MITIELKKKKKIHTTVAEKIKNISEEQNEKLKVKNVKK